MLHFLVCSVDLESELNSLSVELHQVISTSVDNCILIFHYDLQLVTLLLKLLELKQHIHAFEACGEGELQR